MAIARPIESLEAFLQRPDEKPALIYRDGAVTQKVSPKGIHSRLQSTFWHRLTQAVEPRRLAIVFTELRASYAGASTVPDLALYRWSRIPRGARGRIADDFRIPPDIAIEIISPGQTLTNQRELCQWYVDHGVEIALLVNPRNDTVERFRAGEPVRRLAGDDLIDLAPVLPDFRLTVAELFEPLWLEA